MKKYFNIFLVCVLYCSFGIFAKIQAELSSPEHKHCGRIDNPPYYTHSCYANCSAPRFLTFVEDFDEKIIFADCKEHFLIKYTKILHYSDGTSSVHYNYKIFRTDGDIVADNLYHAKHFVNSQGKHYFLVKSKEYDKKNYVIMNAKGNVLQKNGYSEYEILGKDNLIVKQNKKYGIVDFNNNVILDIKYNLIKAYDYILLTKYNGYYGLADKNGKIVLENKYDKITKYGNVFVLKYKNKYGITDLKGKILYTPLFDSLKQSGDFLMVKENNRYGIIDINGKLVAPIKYKKVCIERNTPKVFEK